MHRNSIGAAAFAAVLLTSVAVYGAAAGALGKKDVKSVKVGFAQQTLTAPYYVAMQKEAQKVAGDKGFQLVFQAVETAMWI